MKKIAISFAALAISAGSALAADLPSRKAAPMLPPPPPPAPMWTGFYVGLNAGGTWADGSTTVSSLGLLPNTELVALLATGGVPANSSGGFIGGGQIGYNYQFYGSLVAGVEADFQGLASSNGASQLNTLLTTVNVNSSLDYLGTVRGRLGWLVTPTLLVYGTGGFAYGGVTLNSTVFQNLGVVAGIGSMSFSDTMTGWTAGGGVEWMFLPNWSAKVEYLRYDLGTVSQTAAVSVLGVPYMATTTRARLEGNVVRAGLNYHFNWGAPAPVLAKY